MRPVKHLSEAELLETWYMAPGASLPSMLHVADCAECSARYERLEGKFSSLFTCPHANAWRRRAIGAVLSIILALGVLVTLAWPLFDVT